MSFNYQLYRFKYRYGKYLPLKKPVDISLELSSLCNQSCGYCYHASPQTLPFKRGNMSWSVAEKIITQGAKLGVHSIKTNWRGESSINKHFERITALAKELSGKSTYIDRLSNSNFKFSHDREDIFRAFCNQTKVKISFDSFKKDVFEHQRAGGIYDLALKNIDKFYNYPGRNNQVIIQAVRTKLNKDEDIYSIAKKRWPDAEISIREVVEGRVDNDIDEFVNEHRDNSERKPCLQAFVRIIFNHEGKAFPCCPTIKEDLYLGDINKDSMLDIFNSHNAKYLRENLKDGIAFKYDPCRTCSSFESYKGYKPTWNS